MGGSVRLVGGGSKQENSSYGEQRVRCQPVLLIGEGGKVGEGSYRGERLTGNPSVLTVLMVSATTVFLSSVTRDNLVESEVT